MEGDSYGTEQQSGDLGWAGAEAMIDSRRRVVALLVAGCFFMENLDGTIVVTAAPALSRALHVPATSVGLVISSYLLTLAALIPLSGWMGRRFGSRPVFVTATALFTVASALCACSADLPVLVAMRVLQGIGGAMMVPVGRQVVFESAPREHIVRLMAFIVWPALLAPVIAPVLGGLIVTHASWRWLFLINVPLGAVASIVAWRIVPSNLPSRASGLDRVGMLMTGAGLVMLTYGAHLVSDDARPGVGLFWGLIGFLMLAAAVRHLLQADEPLIDLRVMQVRTFRAAQTSGLLFLLVIASTPFLLTLLLQQSFGWSPVKAGSIVLWIFAGNIAIKPATTWLLARLGFRGVLVAATCGLTCTTGAMAALTATTPVVIIASVACLAGVFRSLGMTAYSTIALSDVRPAQVRDANVLAATVLQLASGLAIALATVLLREGNAMAGHLSGLHAAHGGFAIAFVALASIALVTVVGAARLPERAGSALLA